MKVRLFLGLIAAAALALPGGAQTRLTRNMAVQSCQNEVRQQAMDRFGTNSISFPRINTNQTLSSSGRVSGMIRLGAGPNAEVRHFSCSVNFLTGHLRSARVEGSRGSAIGEAGRDVNARAMENCQAAIGDRVRDEGYTGVQFNSTNINPDGGRVFGTVRAQGVSHAQSFGYSCSVNLDSGLIRGTSLSRR